MDVGILMLVEMLQPVDDGARLLGSRGVIQPDQLTPVDPLLQNWKIAPNRAHIKRRTESLQRGLRLGWPIRTPMLRTAMFQKIECR
jgi:hypothetical protein